MDENAMPQRPLTESDRTVIGIAPKEKKEKPKRKKRVKKKKEDYGLPQKIIAFPNADKEKFVDEWYEGRDPLDIPRVFRAMLAGPPSSGKSLFTFNVLARSDFDRVFLVHLDPCSSEYDDIDIYFRSEELPPLDLLRQDPHLDKLLIIEDMNMSTLNKHDLYNLDRIMGAVSSHSNVSVIFTAQDPMACPPCVRRMCNVFVLWKLPDLAALSLIAPRTGFRSEEYRQFFRHLKSSYDFLMLDGTRDTPYPIRINGYTYLDQEGNILE